MAKTWKQKLEDGKEPRLTTLNKAMGGVPAGGTLLMPTPQLVKSFMDTLPPGVGVKFDEMRAELARRNGGDLSCPLTSSMAARTVAEAAWEDIQAGVDSSEVTPFWRVIEPNSGVGQKLAGGPSFVRAMREQEGIA